MQSKLTLLYIFCLGQLVSLISVEESKEELRAKFSWADPTNPKDLFEHDRTTSRLLR